MGISTTTNESESLIGDEENIYIDSDLISLITESNTDSSTIDLTDTISLNDSIDDDDSIFIDLNDGTS